MKYSGQWGHLTITATKKMTKNNQMFIITTVYNLQWILIDGEFSMVCRISSIPHLIDQVWNKIKAFSHHSRVATSFLELMELKSMWHKTVMASRAIHGQQQQLVRPQTTACVSLIRNFTLHIMQLGFRPFDWVIFCVKHIWKHTLTHTDHFYTNGEYTTWHSFNNLPLTVTLTEAELNKMETHTHNTRPQRLTVCSCSCHCKGRMSGRWRTCMCVNVCVSWGVQMAFSRSLIQTTPSCRGLYHLTSSY